MLPLAWQVPDQETLLLELGHLCYLRVEMALKRKQEEFCKLIEI
jgi:hypothetical protein